MKQPLNRCVAASLRRFCDSTIQRFNGWPVLLLAALFFPAAARAETPLLDAATTRSSVSGQFFVLGLSPSQSSNRPPFAVTNGELVRLDPALLAVAAERIKRAVWRQLGVDALTPWRGRIFLALHPATTPDEPVAIISTRFAGVWNYRVELPDVVARTRLTRALTGAVLLELANRDNPGDRAAETPAWLTEGLAQQLLANGSQEMILAPPDKLVNGVLASQITVVQRGVDELARARAVLHDGPTLTFEQLSWPDDAQLRDEDGGVYRASAQLFVSDLLALNDGPKNLRALLQMLPRSYNWQIAFRAAFRADFPQPIDVEKWWALQSVSFDSRDAGPLWTPAASHDKLDEILSVPVEMRPAATNLPVHAVISLQAVIRNFAYERQKAVLQIKQRDLELAHWRMAPQYVVLTEAYRRVLAEYLDQGTAPVLTPGKTPQPSPGAPSKRKAAAAIKKLDGLDAQRRTLETAIRRNGPADAPL
jgi:hypothetical protein